MDKHSVLRSINLIEEATMHSELDVTMDLCESYNKMISILECYGDDVTAADDIMVFQEADNNKSSDSVLEKIKQFLKKIIESAQGFFNKLMKKVQRETTPIVDKMKKQPKASKKKLNQVLAAAGCAAVVATGAGVAYHVTHKKKDDTKPKEDDTKPKEDDTKPKEDDTKPKEDEYINQINETIDETQKRGEVLVKKLESVFEEPDTDFIKKIKGYDEIIDNIKKSQTINMKFDFEKEEVSCSIDLSTLNNMMMLMENRFFGIFDNPYETTKKAIQNRIERTNNPIFPYCVSFAQFDVHISLFNYGIRDLNKAVSKGIDHYKEKDITEKEMMSAMKWLGKFIQAVTPIINLELETFNKVMGLAYKITETPGWLDD